MTAVQTAQCLDQIKKRAEGIFSQYASGLDVATGERLRLEGFIQAGLVLGLVEFDDVLAVLDSLHQQAFGKPFEVFPPCDEASCVIAIPTRMQRAPVYSSTKD